MFVEEFLWKKITKELSTVLFSVIFTGQIEDKFEML